jgi:two-component system sensor histidine kinase/response regulator
LLPEQQYIDTLDAMADAIHIVDRQMRIVLLNERCRLWVTELGFDADVIGRHLRDAFPFLPDQVMDEYGLVFASGRLLVTEEQVGLGSNTYFTEVRKIPLRIDGTVTGILTVVRDATAYRRSEQMLRNSENRFRRLAEDAKDIVYRMSLADGRYEYVSPACTEITGYTPEEHYATPALIRQAIHPDWTGYFVHHWEQLKAGVVPPSYEYQIVHRSGAVRWLHQRNTLVRDSRGNPVAIEGLVTDITERKEAEAALRQSEERYRTAIEQSNDGVKIVQDDRYVFVNRKLVEMFGYDSAEDIVGLPLGALVHPDDRERVLDINRRRLIGEAAPSQYELRHIRKDGTTLEAELSVAPIQHQGRPALLLFTRNITERKAAERALRESEERFRNTFDQAAVGIAHVGLDGRFIRVNRKFASIAGHPIGELVKKTFKEITHPEDLEVDLENARRLLEGNIPTYSTEKRYIRGNASIVWVNLTVSLARQPSGEPDYFIRVVEDITERKRLEQALRESEEKYRTIFENSVQGIYRVAPDGRFLSANPAAARIIGYDSPEEMMEAITDINTQVYAFPEDRLRAVALLKESGYLKDFEVQCRHKDGGTVWVSFNARLIHDEQGNLLYHEGTSQDITERKNLEKELRQQHDHLEELVVERTDELAKREQMYRAFVETISEWIWETDADGFFTYASPHVFDILGYSPTEVVGKQLTDFMPPKEARRVKRSLRRLNREGRPIRAFESFCIHKHGHPVYRETNGIPFFGHDGKLLGYRGSDRDISEQKRIVDELRARKGELENKTNRLEEVNTTLNVLLQQREKDKGNLQRATLSNIKRLVMPYVQKLQKSRLTDSQAMILDVLATNLKEIASSYMEDITLQHFQFTTRELEVISLIKAGKTTREIGALLGLGKAAIDSYRNHIRKKLGLNKRKVNLQAYLASLS